MLQLQLIGLIFAVVELAESVEFKSLPSGLHNVREDLMSVVCLHIDVSAYSL